MIKDSVSHDFTIRSSPNSAFFYGNLLWFTASPVAYLVDFTNKKRFYYGKNVFLNFFDSSHVYQPMIMRGYNSYFSKRFSTQRHQLNFVVSVPYVNSFYFKPQNETVKLSTGFFGLSLGLEYFYRDNKYLSISANGVVDYSFPIPLPVEQFGKYEVESLNSIYLSVSNNYKFNRFSFGYGINLSKNIYNNNYSYDTIGFPSRKASYSLGVTLNTYHQISKHLYVGIIYRPTFLRISPTTELVYEHLFSIDFAWKIKIGRKRQ